MALQQQIQALQTKLQNALDAGIEEVNPTHVECLFDGCHQ